MLTNEYFSRENTWAVSKIAQAMRFFKYPTVEMEEIFMLVCSINLVKIVGQMRDNHRT